MKPAKRPFNPWPYAIIGWFVIFISSMVTWAVYAMRQDMDLVRSDYYEAEVRYQKQMDQLNRTQAIEADVSLVFDPATREIKLAVPESKSVSTFGKVHLYRPSNARLDQKLTFNPDTSGRQSIDGSKLEPGLWKVRLEWASDGKSYFVDRPIIVTAL